MKQQTNQSVVEWKEVALGDEEYFNILSSGINKFQGEKDYLSTESIKGTKIGKVECKITYENRPSRANMQPILNSVWFAKMKLTLKVYSFSEKNKEEFSRYILSTGFAGIKFDKNIYSEYVKFFFLTTRFNEEKDKFSTGSTQSGINNSFISKIKIPIPFSNGKPDIKEQERIVKILEKAEKLKERGKNSKYLLDEYIRSVFNEMFYNNGFEEIELGKITEKVTDGEHITPKRFDKGIYLLSARNIKNHYIALDNVDYIDEIEYTRISKRIKPTIGDVLVSCSGTIGNVVCVRSDLKFQLVRSVALIRTKKNILNPMFLEYLFESDLMKRQIKNSVKQGLQANLFQGQIKKLKALVPPLKFQKDFENIVEHVEKLKENVKKTNTHSKALFNSLMHKAFRGEL